MTDEPQSNSTSRGSAPPPLPPSLPSSTAQSGDSAPKESQLLLIIVILVFAAPYFLLEKWDQRYDSALLRAIIAHDVSAARHALSDGADMSVTFREGGTLLHVVAYHGGVEIAKLLVEHGAARELQATDSNGDTAEEIAIQNRHSELAAYLRSLATTNGAEKSK